MQFFFEIVAGKPPIPLLPVETHSGAARVEDADRHIFLLPEAAKRSGQSEQYLRDLWLGTWAEFVAPDESVSNTEGKEGISDAPASRVESARHLVLRAMLFPHLDDAEFDAFCELCRLKGLNPYARQVYAKKQFDKRIEKQVVMPIVGIEGMRIIAHRTALFAGADDVEFTFDDRGRLEKAKATVYRLTGEQRFSYAATVYWAEYAPLGDDEFYAAMPCVSLGRDAEAAALRKAFPQELGGIYTPEELRRMDSVYQRRTESVLEDSQVESETRSRDSIRSQVTGLNAAPMYSAPDAPRTYDRFIEQLESLGIGEDAAQVKLVRHFREKRLALADQNPPAFWKYVLDEVRKDPARWGAKVEMAA